MEFYCSECEYSSVVKQSVYRHINKKNKCGENPMMMTRNVEISCEYCNSIFTTKPILNRHLKTCKVKKDEVNKEYLEIKELKEELKVQKEELKVQKEELKVQKEELAIQKALAKKPNVTINNTNNTNNNINLTSYNNPNLDNIDQFFDMCARKQFMCIPKLVELIHFNSELPENHNLLLTNFRSDIMKAYKGNKWHTVDFEEITNELIGNYERDLEDWAGEDPNKTIHVNRWNDLKLRDGEDIIHKDLQKELRKVMYDNRGVVKFKN